MLQLPPEIWAMVIGFLRQPIPPAGQRHVTWKDLHQQDLVTMMRVSSVCILFLYTSIDHRFASQADKHQTMYMAAAPLLYSERVVDDATRLLQGIRPDTTVSRGQVDPIVNTKSQKSATVFVRPAPRASLTQREVLTKVTADHYIYSSADQEPYKRYESANRRTSGQPRAPATSPVTFSPTPQGSLT